MLSESEEREIETFARRHTPYNGHAKSVNAMLIRWEESHQNCSNIVTGKTTRFDMTQSEMRYVYSGLFSIFAKMEDSDHDFHLVRDFLCRLREQINHESLIYYKARKEKLEIDYQAQMKVLDHEISILENFECLSDLQPEPDCT